MKNKIESEVEKTLRALDELQRVQGNPFLSTRIQAKLEESPRNKFSLLTAIRFASVALLITGNLYIGILFTRQYMTVSSAETIAVDYGFQESEEMFDYFNDNQ